MKLALLEEFDEIPMLSAVGGAPQSDQWQAGFAEGAEHATRAAGAEIGRLSEELVQCVQDMSFGFAEAKAEILRQLEPFFEALAVKFIPEFTEATLVPMVQSALMEHAKQVIEKPPVLAVSASQFLTFNKVLGTLPNCPVETKIDPSLKNDEAIISTSSSETMIDFASTVQQVQEVLAVFTSEMDGRHSHG